MLRQDDRWVTKGILVFVVIFPHPYSFTTITHKYQPQIQGIKTIQHYQVPDCLNT